MLKLIFKQTWSHLRARSVFPHIIPRFTQVHPDHSEKMPSILQSMQNKIMWKMLIITVNQPHTARCFFVWRREHWMIRILATAVHLETRGEKSLIETTYDCHPAYLLF